MFKFEDFTILSNYYNTFPPLVFPISKERGRSTEIRIDRMIDHKSIMYVETKSKNNFFLSTTFCVNTMSQMISSFMFLPRGEVKFVTERNYTNPDNPQTLARVLSTKGIIYPHVVNFMDLDSLYEKTRIIFEQAIENAFGMSRIMIDPTFETATTIIQFFIGLRETLNARCYEKRINYYIDTFYEGTSRNPVFGLTKDKNKEKASKNMAIAAAIFFMMKNSIGLFGARVETNIRASNNFANYTAINNAVEAKRTEIFKSFDFFKENIEENINKFKPETILENK